MKRQTTRNFLLSVEKRIALLKSLVVINSGTNHVEGVNRVQGLVQSELRRLGFTTSLIKNPLGENVSGELLVGELTGKSKSFITFITHADTVFEPTSAFQSFSLAEGGKIAQGPGVIDDKGGIVVALSGIAEFLSQYESQFSFRFVCAPSEETGSAGFETHFRKFSKECALALGFEPALDNGSIIDGRWGNRWYHIKVDGKEAHAGRAHEFGANAAHELVIKLDQLQRLTDYPKQATVNIGSLSGGNEKFNVVCGHAEGKIDARFANERTRDSLHKRIESILKKTVVYSHRGKIPTKTAYTLANDCPPLEPCPEAKPLVEAYLASIKKIEGAKIKVEVSRGAADINGMGRKGLIAIDGLGAWGGRMHSDEEFIHLSSLQTRASALSELLHLAQTQLKWS